MTALSRLARRMRRRPVASELTDRVAAIPMWWHSIDLGHGVVTPGVKPVDLEAELASLQLPDLRGKTVLDVGAWDGFYAFAAERLGAARVVALDHHAWSIDRRTSTGEHPGDWRPDTLPGKAGFDLAREALNSRVEPLVADFMEVDASSLGTFDVVLFLGVLYHLRHPLLALERLAAVTGELAVIETEAAEVPGARDRALCEFVENEYKGDRTNWWVPNRRAVVALCHAAGFGDVRVVTPAPHAGSYRLVAHALKGSR